MELSLKSKTEHSAEIEWRIPNFPSQNSKVGEHHQSPSFSFISENWRLEVYLSGCDFLKPEYIHVYFIRNDKGPPLELQYTLGLIGTDGKRNQVSSEKYCFNGRFLTREDGLILASYPIQKKSEFLSQACLVIFCTLRCEGIHVSSENDVNSERRVLKEGTKKDVSEAICIKGENDINSERRVFKEGVKKDVSEATCIKGVDRLAQNLKHLLLDGTHSDAVLKADSREFPVHKGILSARSVVFTSMFEHEMSEKTSGVVDIPDCTAKSFEAFLAFLYTGSCDVSADNVFNLYYAADKYQIDDLKAGCVAYMKSTLSMDNFCDLLALSLRHMETDLQEAATRYFFQNMKKIIKTVQWQKYMSENSTHANELFIKALNA